MGALTGQQLEAADVVMEDDYRPFLGACCPVSNRGRHGR